jgi:hypothetical protein
MIHFHHLVLNGIFLVLTGLIIRFKVGQRRFRRRNMIGMQIFSSYAQGIVTRCIEGLAAFMGRIFILIGLILLIAASFG